LNGNTITLGYTGKQLTSLTHSSGQYIQIDYSGAGLIQTVTDSLGHQTTLTYDAGNQHLTGAHYFDGRTSTYTYNTTGNAAQMHELTAASMSCCNWRYFTYDSVGRLTGTYLGGNYEAVTFSYPSSGEVVATDALNNSSKFYYEHRGLLAKTEDALVNAMHRTFDNGYNLVAVTDPTGRSYNYSYDSQGNLTSSQDPQGGRIQFAYTTHSTGLRH
jgi:YD repeat-containing protein